MKTLSAVGLGAALLASVAAAAGNPPGTRVIHTKPRLESFAVGGGRIAYDLEGGIGCNRILALVLRTGRRTQVSGKETCRADSTSTGAGVRELAVAGSRFAWIVEHGGNTFSNDYLYTSSLPRPAERRLASSQRFGEPGGRQTGTWIGHLVASGNLLAVSRWTTGRDGEVTHSGVDVIVGDRLRRIASSSKAVLHLAADAGRIAVLYGDGSVEIYGASGARLRTVEVGAGTEVALRGDSLVVLTEDKTLEVYSARTGAFRRSWPVQAQAPGELDAHGGLAIYVAHPRYTLQSYRIVAVNLRSGRNAVVARGNWQQRQNAELDAAGLLYARDRHNLVLLPLKRVLAAVS